MTVSDADREEALEAMWVSARAEPFDEYEALVGFPTKRDEVTERAAFLMLDALIALGWTPPVKLDLSSYVSAPVGEAMRESKATMGTTARMPVKPSREALIEFFANHGNLHEPLRREIAGKWADALLADEGLWGAALPAPQEGTR